MVIPPILAHVHFDFHVTLLLIFSCSFPIELPQISTSSFSTAESHSQWILRLRLWPPNGCFPAVCSATDQWFFSSTPSPVGRPGAAAEPRPPPGSPSDQIPESSVPYKSHGKLSPDTSSDAFVRGKLVREKRKHVWKSVFADKQGSSWRAPDARWILRRTFLCWLSCWKRTFSTDAKKPKLESGSLAPHSKAPISGVPPPLRPSATEPQVPFPANLSPNSCADSDLDKGRAIVTVTARFPFREWRFSLTQRMWFPCSTKEEQFQLNRLGHRGRQRWWVQRKIWDSPLGWSIFKRKSLLLGDTRV